jgi:hypothetical protein
MAQGDVELPRGHRQSYGLLPCITTVLQRFHMKVHVTLRESCAIAGAP